MSPGAVPTSLLQQQNFPIPRISPGSPNPRDSLFYQSAAPASLLFVPQDLEKRDKNRALKVKSQGKKLLPELKPGAPGCSFQLSWDKQGLGEHHTSHRLRFGTEFGVNSNLTLYTLDGQSCQTPNPKGKQQQEVFPQEGSTYVPDHDPFEFIDLGLRLCHLVWALAL